MDEYSVVFARSARKERHGSKAGYSSGWLGSTPGGRRAQIRGLRAGARWLLPPRPQPQLLSPARVATLNHAQVLPPLRRQLLGRTRILACQSTSWAIGYEKSVYARVF